MKDYRGKDDNQVLWKFDAALKARINLGRDRLAAEKKATLAWRGVAIDDAVYCSAWELAFRRIAQTRCRPFDRHAAPPGAGRPFCAGKRLPTGGRYFPVFFAGVLVDVFTPIFIW
ncbi:MAG: hypothetical protein JWP63_3621 [Candidatus Solibacter sp.]|nr:hypothetical protein [Candidatus Solibacter sp.]